MDDTSAIPRPIQPAVPGWLRWPPTVEELRDTSTSPLPHEQHDLACSVTASDTRFYTPNRPRQHLRSLPSDSCRDLTTLRPSLDPEPAAFPLPHDPFPLPAAQVRTLEPCHPATARPSSTQPCRPFAHAPLRRRLRAQRRSPDRSTRASSGAWLARSQRTSRRRRTSCRSWRSVSFMCGHDFAGFLSASRPRAGYAFVLVLHGRRLKQRHA